VYAFILSQEQFFPVILMCGVLSVSRSCYCLYRKRSNDPQDTEEQQIEAMVIAAFTLHSGVMASGGCYRNWQAWA